MSCNYCWPGNCCGGPRCDDASASVVIKQLRLAACAARKLGCEKLQEAAALSARADELERHTTDTLLRS